MTTTSSMQDQIKKFITSNIITSITLIILGIIIAIFPEATISVFTYGAGAIMLLYGLYQLITDRENPFGFNFIGVALVVFGINAFVDPDRIASFLPTILGIWFISTSISKLQLSASLRKLNRTLFITSLVLAFISILIGIFLVSSPLEAGKDFMILLGILLAGYAGSDLIDMIIFRINLGKLLTQFDGAEVIKNAEVIKTHKS